MNSRNFDKDFGLMASIYKRTFGVSSAPDFIESFAFG